MHAAVGDDKEWSEYLMPKPSDSTSSSMWHVLGPVIDHDKLFPTSTAVFVAMHLERNSVPGYIIQVDLIVCDS